MAVTAHSLVPVNPRNLMSIDPKNWHRYPPPVVVGGSKPVYVPPIVSTTGAANVGAAAGNAGETGTLSVSRNSDTPYADTGAYTPQTQTDKLAAGNLSPGTIQAVDITKSYHGTRGTIEPFKAYPATIKPPTTVTPRSSCRVSSYDRAA